MEPEGSRVTPGPLVLVLNPLLYFSQTVNGQWERGRWEEEEGEAPHMDRKENPIINKLTRHPGFEKITNEKINLIAFKGKGV